jgi:hypothetical protein
MTQAEPVQGSAVPCQICQKLAAFIDEDVLEDPAVQVRSARLVMKALL